MFVPTTHAHAGLFSFFSGVINSSTSLANAQETRTYLNQSNSVLAAAINTDPYPKKSARGSVIEDDALVPSITPEGTTLGDEKLSSDQISRYIVRSGDTLSLIASMFGVSVNTIRWSNDIPANSKLKIGQELVILPINGVRYVVKKGDTIASIAKKFKGDVNEISNFNDVNISDKLAVGEEIVIPDGIITAVSSVSRQTQNFIGIYAGPDIVGYFMRPLSRSCPKTQGLHGRNGIDIGCPVGTTIVATASGEVVIARGSGWNGGYGQMLVLNHNNGTQTLYGHMSAVSVSAGELITQGQKIGEVGSTGNSTGPHLHFEVRGAKNPF